MERLTQSNAYAEQGAGAFVPPSESGSFGLKSACRSKCRSYGLRSPDKADTFMLARLGFGLRLCRQLQHRSRLALTQQRQQHGPPIGELERIMMCGQLFFVPLAEDRRLMIDGPGLPALISTM
jgi:hypothetical protein